MTDLQAAIETVQRARGWRKCDEFVPPRLKHLCLGWVEVRGGDKRLPDPLADTPEGDHEFERIKLWFRGRMAEMRVWLEVHTFNDEVHARIPGRQMFVALNEKEAVILALADALRKGD